MVILFNILSSLVSTAISLLVVLVVKFIISKHPQEQQAVEQHETNNNTESTAPNQRDNAILGDEHLADRSGLSVLHSCDKIINIIRITLIILKMLAQALLTICLYISFPALFVGFLIRLLLPWFADTMDYRYHFFKTGWNVSIYVSFSVIIWEYVFPKANLTWKRKLFSIVRSCLAVLVWKLLWPFIPNMILIWLTTIVVGMCVLILISIKCLSLQNTIYVLKIIVHIMERVTNFLTKLSCFFRYLNAILAYFRNG